MKRVHSLDALRGLAALSIMCYHYISWSIGYGYPALDRVGYYGVSIFYILSGLTLFIVYQNMKPDAGDLRDFYIKRFFRIYPLLFLATVLTIAVAQVDVSPNDIIINITGLFGFIKWDGYIATGAWSIGNELVFYVFFPLFIIVAKKQSYLKWVVFFILLLIYLWFAFIRIPGESAEQAWKDYINPLNQVFLFYAGFLIGLLLNKINIPNPVTILVCVAATLLFFLVPETGHPVEGMNRILFTAICIVVCVCFYKSGIHFPKPFVLLGQASYSLYLLHPIVWSLSNNIQMPGELRAIACAVVSLAVSYITYLYFEKYFMRIGKRMAVRRKQMLA